MPRAVDRDERLDLISDAVASVASQRGFDQVTIRAVAEHAGASTSVVTHYVASRDELLRLAVRRLVARRRADVTRVVDVADDGGAAGGAAALRAVAEWAVLGAPEPDHRLWLALVTGAQRDAVLRDELDAFNDWWDGLLRDLARRTTADPDEVGRMVDAIDVIVDGLIVTGFDAGRAWSSRRRGDVLTLLLAALGL